MPAIVVTFLKNMALNFIFELLWGELIRWLGEQAKKSETPIDDNVVKWLSGKKPEIEETVRKAVK
jgi:hypothetical protein